MASHSLITTVVVGHALPVVSISLGGLASITTCSAGAGGWSNHMGDIEEQAVVNGRMTTMRCRW